jgi:hypothetical protein
VHGAQHNAHPASKRGDEGASWVKVGSP